MIKKHLEGCIMVTVIRFIQSRIQPVPFETKFVNSLDTNRTFNTAIPKSRDKNVHSLRPKSNY